MSIKRMTKLKEESKGKQKTKKRKWLARNKK